MDKEFKYLQGRTNPKVELKEGKPESGTQREQTENPQQIRDQRR